MPYISSYYGQRQNAYQGYGKSDLEEYLGHPVSEADLCSWYEYLNPFSNYPCTEIKAAWLAKVAALTVLEDPEVTGKAPAFVAIAATEAEKKAKGIISEAERKAESFRRKTIVGSLAVGAILLFGGRIF